MSAPAIRALLVDDEPLVRQGLRRFLEDETDIEIVGEAANGADALERIEDLRPDLVFLDVQMPELDGFGVLDALREGPVPEVIFVTAFDEYALRAFDVHAVDYLLKPFDRARFDTALERARARLEADGREGLEGRLSALLDEIATRRTRPHRFLVRGAGRVSFVDEDDVEWIAAADNYVELHVGDGYHLVRETMKNLEKRLDPHRFVRIHRSTIVRIDRIEELRPLANGDHAVHLKGGVKLTLSRSYRDAFREAVGWDG